jgi:ribonuclease VapC
LIVLDTSALVAVLAGEAEAEPFLRTLVANRPVLLSAVSLLETSVVLCRRGQNPAAAWRDLDALLFRLGVEVVPHDRGLSILAREAFERFGKGRHSAGLNFGDCASYALASARGLPLLFKGDDFAKTDLVAA